VPGQYLSAGRHKAGADPAQAGADRVGACRLGVPGGQHWSAAPVQATSTVPGVPESVPDARNFLRRVIGHHPCAETVVLLASELVTNSIRHSDSRLPGQSVMITAVARANALRIEVTDQSGCTVPTLRTDGDAVEESGRGLQLVDLLADDWGYCRDAGLTTTWFECTA
jgi:anti-sigma regulatory factor (Ser/Thr protein kinase)